MESDDLDDIRLCVHLHSQLRVYIACSLTSEEDKTFKEEILSKTEAIFVRAGFAVYNPATHTPPGSPHTDSEVYAEDVFRPINSDFIIFLRLGRSLGMGLEAQIAADALIPWADARLADESHRLSPLLDGLANSPSEFRATIDRDNLALQRSALHYSHRDSDNG
jgi:hypothetical protein